MPDPTMHCHLCPEVTPLDAIVDHYEGTPVVDTTLVDYLQDKLDRVDDVVCGCPTVSIGTYGDPTAATRGFHPLCPIHGINGTEPEMTAVRWATYALLTGQPIMGD